MKTKTGFIVGLAFSVVAGPLAGLAESPPNRETTHAENERPLPIDLLSHKFVVTATSASPAEFGSAVLLTTSSGFSVYTRPRNTPYMGW